MGDSTSASRTRRDDEKEPGFDDLWRRARKEMEDMEAEFDRTRDIGVPQNLVHLEFRKSTTKSSLNKSSKTTYYDAESHDQDDDSSDDSGIQSKRQTPIPEAKSAGTSTMEYRFKLPGFKAADIKVVIAGNKLIVHGEGNGGNNYRREVTLSKHVDPKSVDAQLKKDGNLKVTFKCRDI